METAQKEEFYVADYIVFLGLITIPSSIGVYFAYKDRKGSSTSKYFFGEKKMHPIAVGISSAVTSISAVTMLGYPSEVYLVGTVYAWAPISIMLAAAVTVVYYIPFYHRLQMETIYVYLERRFNRTARRIVTIMIPISEIFYFGCMIYLPALALSAVAPIPVNVSIGVTGGICTFYTTLGGMKAVVWTDVVQSCLMFGASLVVLVCGINSLGGVDQVTAALERGKRFTFFSTERLNLSSRASPIVIVIGEFFVYNHYLAFAQPIYQRIQSCKNVKQSRYSIIAYVIPAVLIIYVSIANGLLYYAFFEDCDPVKSGLLTRQDQGMPYIALHESAKFRVPGFSGFYVAAVFSGSLSSVSSGLNAYSAVVVEDFAVLIYPKMSEKRKLLVGKISALVLGLIVTSCAYVTSILGSNVFKILRCITGAVGGPVLGMYMLGIFFPWTNPTGAIIGGCFSYTTMVSIFLGSIYLLTSPLPTNLPPITTELCPIENAMLSNMTSHFTATLPATAPSVVEPAYTFDQIVFGLNFHFYVLVGALMTILIGLTVSLITGRNQPANADPRLFMPLIDNKCFSYRVRNLFRCGVPLASSSEMRYVKGKVSHETKK